jgi:hypothetical protein
MHYDDLELCRYGSGALDADEWSVPLYAVGWLEHPHPYNKGRAPESILAKLRSLVSAARFKYASAFRGRHTCSLCLACGQGWPGSDPLSLTHSLNNSEQNIFVPGNNCVYAAPGAIVHYLEIHDYLPPPEFLECVEICPAYGSHEFHQALCHSNDDRPIPLLTFEELFPELKIVSRPKI